MDPADAPLPDKPIGGFFERHEPDGGSGVSVLDAWTAGRPFAAFVNARSAFAALVGARPGAQVWLPAFLCRDLVQPAYAERLRFYPVLPGFEPDLAVVEAEGRAGDLVLAAAYFGLPVAASVRALAQRRPDLTLVEDRAQALGPGLGNGLDWVLYSPRKLLGVADGGLLVGPPGATLPQPTGEPDAAALWAAPIMRADDPPGRNNARWHAANQAKEAAMTVTHEAMTGLSRSILARTPLASLAEPRMSNWRRLNHSLRPWSALPDNPPAPPLGYVLRLPRARRDLLLRGLHAARIFAAVHWPAIAAPAHGFEREQGWTGELLTLPCDHRYSGADMDRIAARVTDILT